MFMTGVRGIMSGGAQTCVIVGGGLAGATAAERLRAQAFVGHIVVYGEESEYPDDRPPLSKGYLHDTTTREDLYVLSPEW